MKQILTLVASIWVLSAQAASIDVPINLATDKGVGDAIGSVTITETAEGLLFTPHLKDIERAGLHGFHVHANASCEPAEQNGMMVPALAAGGHFDPENTKKHLGPYGQGHLGDLPPLYVEEDGSATYPVLAPRLKKLEQIKNKALMIHLGGENNSDKPLPLGGGGLRVACGVIK